MESDREYLSRSDVPTNSNLAPKASIIICSLNRDESLGRLLSSLDKQTRRDFEIIICKDEGNLVELKDKGWRKAKGEICIWLDDDVVCFEDWYENMIELFDEAWWVVGVTGPTLVPKEHLSKRDVFKGGVIGFLYNRIFLDGMARVPGKISSFGATTLGANFDTGYSRRVQVVDFLEPSQFALRRKAVENSGGFDLEYAGVAEFCDVDLCHKAKEFGELIFSPRVKTLHLPIDDGITKKRLETKTRYDNYCRFANRWLQRSWKNNIYRIFLSLYFFFKGKQWI